MSNEELVALIQAGERNRLPELWEQMRHITYMAASRQARILKGRGGVTAEDLYQSGYIALVAAVNSYKPGAGCSFKSWLDIYFKRFFAEAGCLQSKKRALDPIHRAESIDAPIKEGDGAAIILSDILPDTCADQAINDVEDRIWLGQLRAALDAALDELPDNLAETLRHSYYMEQTPEQAIAALGTSRRTFFRWKEKALHTLRQQQELRQFLQD